MTDVPPPPPPEPPTSAGGPVDPAPDGSRKRLLVGGGVVAAVVVVVSALLLMGGDDDGDDVAARLASQIRSEADGQISDDQADCVARHIVEEVGADELEDVDFDEDPPAEIEGELTSALFGAIGECDIDPTVLGDTFDPATDDGATDDGEASDLGDIDFDEGMESVLSDIYEQGLGLERKKAECLAGRLADAIESGDLTEEQAMSDVFQYLQECDISMEEIGN